MASVLYAGIGVACNIPFLQTVFTWISNHSLPLVRHCYNELLRVAWDWEKGFNREVSGSVLGLFRLKIHMFNADLSFFHVTRVWQEGTIQEHRARRLSDLSCRRQTPWLNEKELIKALEGFDDGALEVLMDKNKDKLPVHVLLLHHCVVGSGLIRMPLTCTVSNFWVS